MRWICIASGPSLTAEDCDLVLQRHDGPTIAVNTTFRRAPWATILVAQDAPWWTVYGDEVDERWFGGEIVREVRPRYGRIGNSGHAALEVAVQRGATSVVLLGYDYGNGTHWHGPHDQNIEKLGGHLSNPGPSEYGGPDSPWHKKLREFVKRCPVPMLNASRETTIPESVIPRCSLETVLDCRDLPGSE